MTSAAPLQRRLRSTIGAALARPSGVSRRERLLPAAAVLLGVLAVQFLLGLVAMAQAALTALAVPWPVDPASTPVGAFLTTTLLAPAPFVVAAGAVLVLLPSGSATPLPTWLLRGLAAGAAGTVALAVVGAVRGLTSPFAAASPTFALLSATTVPLTEGIRLTCVLLVSCTLVALVAAPGRRDVATPDGGSGAARADVPEVDDADASPRERGPVSETARWAARPSAPAAPGPTAPAPAAPAPAAPAPPAPRDHSPFLPPEDDR